MVNYGTSKLFEVNDDSSVTANHRFRVIGRAVVGVAATDTAANGHMLRLTNGATYSEIDAGETAFANSSSEDMKTAFAAVPVDSIVAAFDAMPFPRRWKYRESVTGDSAAAAREHASVMAGEFYPVARLLRPRDADLRTLAGDDELAALIVVTKHLLDASADLRLRVEQLEAERGR